MQTLLAILLLVVLLVLLYTAQRHLYSVRARGQAPTKAEPTADAYATYFMVVGLERSKEIIANTPDIEALLIYGDQKSMHQYISEGMKKITKVEN